MECVDSSLNYSEPAYVVNSLDVDTVIDRIPATKNSLQCTFFRPPKRELKTKNGTYQLPNTNPLLSDTCTDTDSELEESSNAEQWLETFLKDSNKYTIDEKGLISDRSHGRPKVRFGATFCINVNETAKPEDLKKRWIKEETASVPVKLKRVIKQKTCLMDRSCLKNAKYDRMFNTDPGMYEQQATKNEIFLEERVNDPQSMGVLSDTRNILNGNRISQPANKATTDEAKENVIGNRIVRNKRLLRSMEEVIRTMNASNVNLKSCQSIQPTNKAAKIDIACEQQKSLKEILNDREEMGKETPFFTNPQLEKDLDESMLKAVEKYRSCRRKWKKMTEEKT